MYGSLRPITCNFPQCSGRRTCHSTGFARPRTRKTGVPVSTQAHSDPNWRPTRGLQSVVALASGNTLPTRMRAAGWTLNRPDDAHVHQYERADDHDNRNDDRGAARGTPGGTDPGNRALVAPMGLVWRKPSPSATRQNQPYGVSMAHAIGRTVQQDGRRGAFRAGCGDGRVNRLPALLLRCAPRSPLWSRGRCTRSPCRGGEGRV